MASNNNINELSISSTSSLSSSNKIKKELFFDRKAQYSMEYFLDKNTTCQQILSLNNKIFIQKLNLIKKLPENFDLNEEIEKGKYYFCITKSKKNLNIDKEKKAFGAMDIKLDLEEKFYDLLFIQDNLILCFLEKNNSKINLRKKARSLFVLDKDIYEDTDSLNLQDNNQKDNNSNDKLYNKNIFYLTPKNFIKKDIIIDYEKIYLMKDKIEIYIKEIKTIKFFLHNSEEYKQSEIKGENKYLILF